MNALLLNINKDKCSGHETFLKYSLWVVNFFDPYGATADDDWMDGCMMDEWMDGWWMDDDGWMEQMQLMLKPMNQKNKKASPLQTLLLIGCFVRAVPCHVSAIKLPV